jgi:hypothetical protein
MKHRKNQQGELKGAREAAPSVKQNADDAKLLPINQENGQPLWDHNLWM